MEDLIPQFVRIYGEAQKLLDTNDLVAAKQKYLSLLDVYHSIEISALESCHKELAHQQLSTLFTKLNYEKTTATPPYNIIAAAVVIIAFSALIFLKPSIVGLATFDQTMRQEINVTFKESGLYTVTLSDRPLSLLASGNFSGTAKLYYKQGNKLQLIFSGTNTTASFSTSCIETCTVNADSKTIELFVELEPKSTLTLQTLTYAVPLRANTAPAWKGAQHTFKASLNTPTTLDLNDYFTDSENDPIIYLATTDDGLDLSVQNSKVTLTAQTAGQKKIIFIASDLRDVTRVPITIDAS